MIRIALGFNDHISSLDLSITNATILTMIAWTEADQVVDYVLDCGERADGGEGVFFDTINPNFDHFIQELKEAIAEACGEE